MMADRRSCPWWLNTGKTLLFPGWMDIFKYGSGLKNIPFFKPIARKSERKKRKIRTKNPSTLLFCSVRTKEIYYVAVSVRSPVKVKLMSFLGCSTPTCSVRPSTCLRVDNKRQQKENKGTHFSFRNCFTNFCLAIVKQLLNVSIL